MAIAQLSTSASATFASRRASSSSARLFRGRHVAVAPPTRASSSSGGAATTTTTSAPDATTDDGAPIVPKIKGKTAVVTGGSQGCGRATALALAREGYNVVVVARDAERCESAATAVAAAAGRPEAGRAVPADISDVTSVNEMARQIVERYEEVTLVVNNAGACCTMPFEDTDDEAWDWQMQTNVLGAVRVTRALLPSLRAAAAAAKPGASANDGGAAIIFVNSFGGVIPLRGMSAYTASKFALAGGAFPRGGQELYFHTFDTTFTNPPVYSSVVRFEPPFTTSHKNSDALFTFSQAGPIYRRVYECDWTNQTCVRV